MLGGTVNFTHYDLGHLGGGETVVVTLSGTEANARLMDDSNSKSYRAGRNHHYYG